VISPFGGGAKSGRAPRGISGGPPVGRAWGAPIKKGGGKGGMGGKDPHTGEPYGEKGGAFNTGKAGTTREGEY